MFFKETDFRHGWITQSSILTGDLLSYKGAIFENLVADVLGKMERKLYYHVESALKLGDYNIGRSNNLFTIPMYMAFLLTEV